MTNGIVALYIRLSVEDRKCAGMSIENQQALLHEKAASLSEYSDCEIMEFIDNGYTGTNFERPSVQSLLELVRSGRIKCIIVKDLSRFGRNSIEAAYFIEKVFPVYHVRLISLGDGFDTAEHKGDTGGIDIAFKYLINEFYAKDISVKVKSAKQAKMRRGEYQSTLCPYGYQKGADGRMQPDENAAVVRKIFEWYADGYDSTQIVKKLHELHIPTPGEYRASKGQRLNDVSRTNGVWNNTTVLVILKDERYTGAYVSGKHRLLEIGKPNVRTKDKSEWIIIPDHHEKIVSKELFDLVNSKIQGNKIPVRKYHDYLLKGKLICGCCGASLSKMGKTSFYCRKSSVIPDMECHGLSAPIKELEQAVFDTIRLQSECFLFSENEKNKAELFSARQEEQDRKISYLQETKRHLYEQYTLGEIDIAAYKAKKSELDIQIANEKNVAAVISAEAEAARGNYEESIRQKKIADELNAADTLTASLVDMLIKKVYVFPDNRIEIEYAVADYFRK